jgi:hypothetical protein
MFLYFSFNLKKIIKTYNLISFSIKCVSKY